MKSSLGGINMKCALCYKEASGAKQFNNIVHRIYLCRKHLVECWNMDSFGDGKEMLEKLK